MSDPTLSNNQVSDILMEAADLMRVAALQAKSTIGKTAAAAAHEALFRLNLGLLIAEAKNEGNYAATTSPLTENQRRLPGLDSYS